jgi:trehalose 6-phosphate synthase/phosphatase
MRNRRRHLTESGKAWSGLIQAYRAAARRALPLDYDGTLVPFVEDPKLVRPDAELMDLLERLGKRTGNEVMVVSGRPRRDLEEWFGQ